MVRLSQSIAEYAIVLIAGYFDESTDEDTENSSYSVAGYICSGMSSYQFACKWKGLLRHFNLDYFKASEIEMGFGQFAQFRDDPDSLGKPLTKREKDKIREIKTAFVDLICQDTDLIGVGACLSLVDYYRFRFENPELSKRTPPAYSLCAQLTMHRAARVVTDHNSLSKYEHQAMLRPIFDWQEQHSGRFELSFESFKIKNPKHSQVLLPPLYEIEQNYMCLQAADCLSYEARRYHNQLLCHPEKPERKAWTRLKETLIGMYKVGYGDLKLLAENQKEDLIPIQTSLGRRYETMARVLR